jgi:hypothetical protein
MMTWENELTQFYEKLKPKPVFSSKDEINSFLDDVVVPAFEEIAAEMKKHTKSVKIKKYVSKATISFEDQIAKRSVFAVSVDFKYQSISFPYILNGTSTYTSGTTIKNRAELDRDFIISAFMKFFLSRAENIRETERVKSSAINEFSE